MTYAIRYARVMPSAQVRLRRRFSSLMENASQRIGAIILSESVDDVVPVERAGVVSGRALDVISDVFTAGRREVVRADGMPQSPYARVLLEEIGIVTYEMVQAHTRFLERVLPGDVRLWMRRGVRVSELDEAQVRERFPQLTDADVTLVADARIFNPNRLAEYERAHTWVDPRGYRLSDRIWRVDQRTRDKLDGLMIDAIAEGRSARDIARRVEQYLTPGREKIRTNRPYGSDASYDAMRLARTEIARAANNAAYISSYMNPYVEQMDVIRSANGSRKCPICPQHATISFGGERLRPPYSIHAMNNAPYHPHCMCRAQAVPADDVGTVENRLRRMVEASRQTNLVPFVNPTDAEAFTQRLLGEILWNITRQVLPAQPRLL